MVGRTCSVALLCLVLSSAGALEVNIPKDIFEFARGDNITLPCTFKSKIAAPTLAIISWSAEGTTAGAKETLILTHYYPTGKTDIKSMYEGRVSLDISVPTGKANIKLSSITLADNKQFECRVQIPGDDEGKPADTARLVVLVAPSKPVCNIQGKAEYGQNINLTCKSDEGSPPPTYKWDSRDVRNAPRMKEPRTTDRNGILSLFNISKETSGYYVCTSSNKIRSATCNLTLAVMPPSMALGSTGQTIIGIVVGVAALIGLIVLIYCCCCRKKKEKEEYAMGVRSEEEFRDKEPARNGQADGQEDSAADRPDRYEERSERGRDYDDRRSDYDDRRSDFDDRRSDYNERRSDHDDRRSDYNDRRSDYDDRRDRYNDHHDDDRRYNDRRDDDRYDEPYDDRDKPNTRPRRDYED